MNPTPSAAAPALGTDSLGPLAGPWAAAVERLDRGRVAERIRARDIHLWSEDPTELADRLGWLTVADDLLPEVPELAAFAEEVRRGGVRDVVLLGMGGSSLGAEALRSSFREAGGCRLHVLDSTVPAWIRRVRAAIDPESTLFLVASKSGGTLEVASLEAYFREEARSALGERSARRFAAITDPGSPLAARAEAAGYRRIFLNPSDIGGRYSVLSYFGLVPAALLGLDLGRLLGRASRMAAACRHEAGNPGLELGALLGAAALAGRWKATLLTTPRIADFGLWAEQLIAESTGKGGKGILPVAGEPAGPPEAYGSDRLFLALRLEGDDTEELDARVAALAAAGQPVALLHLRDLYDLGGELFRWEMATAVAGHLLEIQPFDQPDVQAAKNRTKRAIESYRASGHLPAAREASPADLGGLLAAELPEYLAIMAYHTPDPAFEAAIEALRGRLLARFSLATTFGYGPRLLHSTGQLHKGGPPGGLFLQLVSAGEEPIPVPGAGYDFAVLAEAQALGDQLALEDAGRTCLRISLGEDPVGVVESLAP